MYKQLEGLVLETAVGPKGNKVWPEASKTAWQPEKKVEMHLAEGTVGIFICKSRAAFGISWFRSWDTVSLWLC